MTWAEPTTITVRLLIAIGVDRPTSVILWLEDHFGCQYDLIRIVFVIIDDEANHEESTAGATMIESY